MLPHSSLIKMSQQSYYPAWWPVSQWEPTFCTFHAKRESFSPQRTFLLNCLKFPSIPTFWHGDSYLRWFDNWVCSRWTDGYKPSTRHQSSRSCDLGNKKYGHDSMPHRLTLIVWGGGWFVCFWDFLNQKHPENEPSIYFVNHRLFPVTVKIF